MSKSIPTENIGSLPREFDLVDAYSNYDKGLINRKQLDEKIVLSTKEAISKLGSLGQGIVTDGEIGKRDFITYLFDKDLLSFEQGACVPFSDGHIRKLPCFNNNAKHPLKVATHSRDYVLLAKKYTNLPIKQAVISPSALSLFYPVVPIPGYPRDKFQEDIINIVVNDIKECFEAGAAKVQIDSTELRLSLLLDPSGGLTSDFVKLNNAVLERFSPQERAKIGFHVCGGADQCSDHSLKVDLTELLPHLFSIKAGIFYIPLCGEYDREKILATVASLKSPEQQIFFGVIDVNSPKVETPEEVKNLILLISQYIPIESFGTCDDCGFSPFSNDLSRNRETVFAKIQSRIEGTKLASKLLNL